MSVTPAMFSSKRNGTPAVFICLICVRIFWASNRHEAVQQNTKKRTKAAIFSIITMADNNDDTMSDAAPGTPTAAEERPPPRLLITKMVRRLASLGHLAHPF